MKGGSLALSAILASALALGGSIPMFGENYPVREPTVPSDLEKQWMASLNSYRREQWKWRFARGLTSEERRYVAEQTQYEEASRD